MPSDLVDEAGGGCAALLNNPAMGATGCQVGDQRPSAALGDASEADTGVGEHEVSERPHRAERIKESETVDRVSL